MAAQMVLQRERLDLSPVFSTAMQHEGHRLGYIRLASFSQKAASDMRRAIDRLEVWGWCLIFCKGLWSTLCEACPTISLRRAT